MRTEDKKLRTRDKINNSSNSLKIKNNLDKIYIALSNSIFSPKDIIKLLNLVPNTATNYINKLKELDLLEKVEGIGQSKFKFKYFLQLYLYIVVNICKNLHLSSKSHLINLWAQ